MPWLTILIIIAAVYALLCALFYFFQHYFFFRPEILPSHFTYKYPFDFEEKTFEMEDGGTINSIYFRVPNSRGVVYYLKGNSRSIKGWGKFAKDFLGNGFDFFMMDYRGFGKSRGKRTESILYNDAQHLYRWLLTQYEEDKIVVYGRSLGSGIATRVASWNHPRMLILDSPYFSFTYNIKRFGWYLPLKLLLRYKIRSDQFIKAMRAPVHIIHGNKDGLIPIRNSHKLVEVDPENVRLYTIEGGGHNNLPDFPEYYECLYDILHDAFHPHSQAVSS
ncbi:MAG: alpha/beta fold hydrolase [Bacteroidota bacterium]